jgi:hypothetical protein
MNRLRFRVLAAALLAPIACASAAELALTVEIPKIEVAEYHRPYVAAWLEREDQSVAANLAVWYDVAGRDGSHWLQDLRQWWRRSGREQQLPIDAVTGATRPVGRHELKLTAGRAPLGELTPGRYTLVVEAVRESGGREAVRIPFEWPAIARETLAATGAHELGAVAVALEP